MNGRFGPGLPRVSDGSLLFLMHLLSKMRPVKDGGSRIGIKLDQTKSTKEERSIGKRSAGTTLPDARPC
jgi:hypothetical protein